MNKYKIPKIINILNTNIIQNTEGQREISNNISISKLQKIIGRNFTNIIGRESSNNKKPSGLELLGQGINGIIYKIKHPDQEYICKCINYSRENIDQLSYEINLIKILQANQASIRYINPCLGIAITQNIIITIFPRFQATTIDRIIEIMCQPEFNIPQRLSLIKYLIYQMILGLAEIHRLGICHRQINTGSILVEINPNSNTTKKITGTLDTKSDKDGIWFSESDIPLRVKYTNFGFGCLNTCLPMLSNLDPYQPNGPTDFEGSQMFDIWCLGLLFIKLLHDPITKTLVSPELEKFLDIINNHMVVSLNQRKPAYYIKEALAINDKFYDITGSDGRTETANLVNKVLSGQI